MVALSVQHFMHKIQYDNSMIILLWGMQSTILVFHTIGYTIIKHYNENRSYNSLICALIINQTNDYF